MRQLIPTALVSMPDDFHRIEATTDLIGHFVNTTMGSCVKVETMGQLRCRIHGCPC